MENFGDRGLKDQQGILGRILVTEASRVNKAFRGEFLRQRLQESTKQLGENLGDRGLKDQQGIWCRILATEASSINKAFGEEFE